MVVDHDHLDWQKIDDYKEQKDRSDLSDYVSE